ncbi:serine protease gd-like [Drosophila kikkawai]|uniref:Serine protease gd-like n=1 Tax=Drosophila kikkawai TaxID=30033 RepID=A0A6P4IJF4_DROKI|nr:transmembrane protease serine 9-like [Drosophila kikkawai]
MRRPQLLVVTALPLLLAFLLVSPALSQLPPNGCFPNFMYESYQGEYIGLVSVRLDPNLMNHQLHLEFSQQGYHDFSKYVGHIVMVDDDNTIRQKVQRNQPVIYRVNFPLSISPPKITRIKINGEEICSASEYPKPRTGITLVHVLTVPTQFGGIPRNWDRPVIDPPTHIINTGDWEQSFPTRTPTRQPSQPSTNNNDDWEWMGSPSNVSLTLNDTLFEPGRHFQPSPANSPSRPNQPAAPVPGRPQSRQPSAIPTTIHPEVHNRETLVSQQAPSSSATIQCGRERATTTPLVFQGTRLQRGQMPWLVGMFERRESNGPIFFCGGSLIGASTVLSAAHCFRIPGFRDLPASSTAVSLGRNSLDLLSDGEFRRVAQLLIHDKYKYEQYTEADLVLVRLETPVPLNDYIVPICLWSTANRMDLPQGEKTYVAGWGPDESGTGNSDIAKLADMNIVSEVNCHRQLPPGPLFQPSTLCAQKAGTGPCSTDGGGPLMLREGGVFVLRGVIAGGALNKERTTCDLARPSVFTDVAKHIDWVRRNMWD